MYVYIYPELTEVYGQMHPEPMERGTLDHKLPVIEVKGYHACIVYVYACECTII